MEVECPFEPPKMAKHSFSSLPLGTQIVSEWVPEAEDLRKKLLEAEVG